MNDSYQQGAIFRVGLASASHWLQPVLVLIVHLWPAPVSVGGLLVNYTSWFSMFVGLQSDGIKDILSFMSHPNTLLQNHYLFAGKYRFLNERSHSYHLSNTCPCVPCPCMPAPCAMSTCSSANNWRMSGMCTMLLMYVSLMWSVALLNWTLTYKWYYTGKACGWGRYLHDMCYYEIGSHIERHPTRKGESREVRAKVGAP